MDQVAGRSSGAHAAERPDPLKVLRDTADMRAVSFAPYPLAPFFDERLYLYALMRADVRSGAPLESAEAQERFVAWWVLAGKEDLPDLALTPEAHGWLLRPVGRIAPPGLPLTRVILAPLHHLPDAAAWLEPDGSVGLKYLAWFLLAVAPRFRLAKLLPPEIGTWLASPADGSGGSGLTVLAALIHGMRPDVARRFDLSDPAGRAAYGAWLRNGGLAELGLAELGLAGHAAAPDRSPYVAPRRGTVKDPTRTGGVNLIGYADAEVGLGEDLRTTAIALESAGVPFSVFNLELDSRIRRGDATLAAHIAEDLPYDINIFCITGFETARLFVQHGPALFRGRHNIGYWPWELPRWPAELRVCYGLVDEVWASSTHTAGCYRRDAVRPVHHMPLTVLPPPALTPRRERFGLPAERFLFLFNFDVSSYMERKNPFAAVEAFRRAFDPDRTDVGLVVKAMRGDPESPAWRRLSDACAADPRIRVINEVLDRVPLLELYACCDAYVSLHRAEGFGRTMAEAMLLELPVIATGWSGNADFVTERTGWPVAYDLRPLGPDDYPFGLGTEWADPRIDAAAAAMRAVAAGGPDVAARRRAGRDLVRATLAPAVRGRIMADRLAAIRADRAKRALGERA